MQSDGVPTMTDDADPQGPREHSASSIALAQRCRHAWALRYLEGWRITEVPWSVIADWEAAHGRSWWFSPSCESGGQRGAALGKEVHARAEHYLVRGVGGIVWDDLPGQILQSMLDHLPPPGSVPAERAEHEFRIEMFGVLWKGLIDLLLDGAGVHDHKTTKDIAAYALLPDAAAEELGVPDRAISRDLQSCIYVGYRTIRTLAPDIPLSWLYVETGPTRRVLPVLQTVDGAQALQVVKRAAEVARECETYQTIADAPPNAMRCDDYGGCWLRGRQCFAQRPWGRLMAQWYADQAGRVGSEPRRMSQKTPADQTPETPASTEKDRTNGSQTPQVRSNQGRRGKGKCQGRQGEQAQAGGGARGGRDRDRGGAGRRD